MLFVGFLCIGLPLPVIPIYVNHALGFSDFAVGVAVGIQFLTTVLTRAYAGRIADLHGGRRSVLQGTLACALGGLIYLLAALLPLTPFGKLSVLVAGRLAVGLGESQLVTGTVSWAIAVMGPRRSSKAIAWTGMAMTGALAAGAPAGLALYQRGGFALLSVASMLAPLLAYLVAWRSAGAIAPAGTRMPMLRVLRRIWRGGASVALQGVGFAAISAFASLYFIAHGWSHAGLAISFFGGAYALVRLLLGHLPDRFGGYQVAAMALLVEAVGQALMWLAPNEATALAGALITGLGCSLVFPALGVEALKTVPAQSRGAAMGGLVGFQDIALGVTGPLTGILAAHAGYPAVFLIGMLAALGGFGMALQARSEQGFHG